VIGWDPKQPWTAPADSAFLYQTGTSWTFVVHNRAGVLDGTLPEEVGETLAVAQGFLVEMIARSTECDYEAVWTAGEPGQ
jgi:hypothetical protein